VVLYVQDSRRRLDVRDGVGKRLETIKNKTLMKLIFHKSPSWFLTNRERRLETKNDKEKTIIISRWPSHLAR